MRGKYFSLICQLTSDKFTIRVMGVCVLWWQRGWGCLIMHT